MWLITISFCVFVAAWIAEPVAVAALTFADFFKEEN